MDGFNTFEKQDKVLLGLNSGADAAAAYRILQQQGDQFRVADDDLAPIPADAAFDLMLCYILIQRRQGSLFFFCAVFLHFFQISENAIYGTCVINTAIRDK